MRTTILMALLLGVAISAQPQTLTTFKQYKEDLPSLKAAFEKLVTAEDGYVDLAGEPVLNENEQPVFKCKAVNLPDYCNCLVDLKGGQIDVYIENDGKKDKVDQMVDIKKAATKVIEPYLSKQGYTYDEKRRLYAKTKQNGKERHATISLLSTNEGDNIRLQLGTTNIYINYDDPQLKALHEKGQAYEKASKTDLRNDYNTIERLTRKLLKAEDEFPAYLGSFTKEVDAKKTFTCKNLDLPEYTSSCNLVKKMGLGRKKDKIFEVTYIHLKFTIEKVSDAEKEAAMVKERLEKLLKFRSSQEGYRFSSRLNAYALETEEKNRMCYAIVKGKESTINVQLVFEHWVEAEPNTVTKTTTTKAEPVEVPQPTSTCDLRTVFAETKSLPEELGKILKADDNLTSIKGTANGKLYTCKGVNLPSCATCHVFQEGAVWKAVIQIPYSSSEERLQQLLEKRVPGAATSNGLLEYDTYQPTDYAFGKKNSNGTIDKILTRTIVSGSNNIAYIEVTKNLSGEEAQMVPEVYLSADQLTSQDLNNFKKSLQTIMSGDVKMTSVKGSKRPYIRSGFTADNRKTGEAYYCKGLNLPNCATCYLLPVDSGKHTLFIFFQFDNKIAAGKAQDVILAAALDGLKAQGFEKDPVWFYQDIEDYLVVNIKSVENEIWQRPFDTDRKEVEVWHALVDQVAVKTWNDDGVMVIIKRDWQHTTEGNLEDWE